jgi:hypothetical protein
MDNFNPKEYRNNLANNLNLQRQTGEEGKLNAQKTLLEVQNTDEYKATKNIKGLKHAAIKLYGEKSFEDKNKIIDNKMEKLGFDIFDISKKIPGDIKLLIEKSKKEGESSYLSIENQEKVHNLLDELSGGIYLGNKCLNHISRHDPHYFRTKNYSKNQAEEIFFSKQRDFTSELITHREEGFYFAVGKNNFLDVKRPIMLFSTENPNFITFLISELIDRETNFITDETIDFITKKYKDSSPQCLTEIKKILDNDPNINNLILENTILIKKDNDEIYRMEDTGYHAKYTSKIIAYLMLFGKKFELSNNSDGVNILGGYDMLDMEKHGVYNKKGESRSFATFSDIIIDLLSEKLYKFNKEKFLN